MVLAASVHTAQLRPHRSVIVLPVQLEKLELVDNALCVRRVVVQIRAELTALVAQLVVLASTGSGARSVHRGISPQMASSAPSRIPDIGQTLRVRGKSCVLAILVVLRESAFRVGPEKRVTLSARNVPLAFDVGTSLAARDASPATQALYPTTRLVQHSASAAPFKEPQQLQAHGTQMLTGLRAASLQLSVTQALSLRRVLLSVWVVRMSAVQHSRHRFSVLQGLAVTHVLLAHSLTPRGLPASLAHLALTPAAVSACLALLVRSRLALLGPPSAIRVCPVSSQPMIAEVASCALQENTHLTGAVELANQANSLPMIWSAAYPALP